MQVLPIEVAMGHSSRLEDEYGKDTTTVREGRLMSKGHVAVGHVDLSTNEGVASPHTPQLDALEIMPQDPSDVPEVCSAKWHHVCPVSPQARPVLVHGARRVACTSTRHGSWGNPRTTATWKWS